MHRALVVTLALAAAAASCTTDSEAAIVVGAVYPTEGSQGPGGLEEYRGVELAAELSNARGEAPTVRLRLEPAETREEAPGAVERLARARVPIVLGSYGSTISRPAANAASRLGLVFWETGAVGDVGMDAAGGRSFFRVPASGAVLGREAVAFVRDRLQLGPNARWAVTYVDDDYGRSVGGGALDEIEQSELTLAAELPYSLPNADYDGLARTVARERVDVLVVAAYLDDGVALRRALVRHRVPLEANIGTSSSYCMPAFGEQLGPDAVGVFASDKPDGDVVDPSELTTEAARTLRWARRTYRERFEEPMPAPALSGFAAAWGLFRHVLPQAQMPTAGDIASAARAVDVPVGNLPDGAGLHFTDDGTNERAASVIWQWVAERERAVVWPPAFATHNIVPST